MDHVEGKITIHFVADGSGSQIDVMVGTRLELAAAGIAYLQNLVDREIGLLPDLDDTVESATASTGDHLG